MLLRLLFLCFVAVATAATQYLNKEPSSFDIDRDGAIKNFLFHAMENYHTWLAKEDPLNPDPTEVTLSTTVLGGYGPVDLDAVLKISNQSMAGHSKPGLGTLLYASSEESRSWLNAARSVSYGEDIKFDGIYNVNGSINFSDTLQLQILFSGQGKWTLKGNSIAEVVAYNYTVDENGYIDLSTSPNATYSYCITWNHIEFEGLVFDYDGEIEESWMPTLQDRLAELYGLFLGNGLAFEQLPESEYNLPRRLFKAYFQERFQSTKLEDIISGWQRTTTTYPTNTETMTTEPTDTETIGAMFLHY